jgi:hypothetical protein
MNPRRACLLLVAVAWAAGGVSADRLELANGDIITGTIERMDSETVTIATEYGVLQIDRDAVIGGAFGRPIEEPTDLLLHLPLDGDLSDHAGDYVVVNNGMRFVADAAGMPESAMRSDGSGTYLSIAASEELNRLNTFTVAFDIRLEENSSTQYLVSKWTRAEGSTADGKFTVQSSGGGITFYVVDSEGMYHWVSAQGVLTQNQWHSVALTFVSGRAAIYVDGLAVANGRFDSTDLLTDTAPLLIMTAEAETEDRFGHYNTVGSIDDVRLYGRALSPDEVAGLSVVSTAVE